MNRQYRYFVAALFVCVSATTVANERPLPPVAPSDVKVRAVSDDSVLVRWYDNSATELGFAVQRSIDGINWRQVGTIDADINRFEDRGLDSSTRYLYRVAAYNRSGQSGFSRIAPVQTFRLAGNYPL